MKIRFFKSGIFFHFQNYICYAHQYIVDLEIEQKAPAIRRYTIVMIEMNFLDFTEKSTGEKLILLMS
jgi:hypothetical protein